MSATTDDLKREAMREYRAKMKAIRDADNEFTSYGKLSANRDIRSTQIRQRHDEMARQLRAEILEKYGPVDPVLKARYTPRANW